VAVGSPLLQAATELQLKLRPHLMELQPKPRRPRTVRLQLVGAEEALAEVEVEDTARSEEVPQHPLAVTERLHKLRLLRTEHRLPNHLRPTEHLQPEEAVEDLAVALEVVEVEDTVP